jgi:hypothetical protein
MSDFLGFAEVTGAIIAAMGLAMCLEWLTLNGLLRLMPSRPEHPASSVKGIAKAEPRRSADFKRTAEGPRNFRALPLFPH